MTNQKPLIKLLKQLWSHLSARRKMQFFLLLLLMVLASFAEIISIGAVLPFLGVLTSPELIFNHPMAQPFINYAGLKEPMQLLLPLTMLFSFAALIAGGGRLLLIWVNTRLAFAAGADLGINIYRRTLYQPYDIHVMRNSSEVISGISAKSNAVIYRIILPVMVLISSSIMLSAILVVLLIVNPVIALVSFGGFGLIYLSIIGLSRKSLKRDSQVVAIKSTAVIKALQEGLGGIRDVLIDGSQEIYCKIYRDADLPMRRAQGNISFMSLSPRYAMEALGLVLIAILAYSLAQQDGGIAKAIPILGALAIGAQRLLPVLQQGYASWTNMQGNKVALEDILGLLEQPLPSYANRSRSGEEVLSFRRSIEINHLSFRYSEQSPWVLKDLNLLINKGDRIGFIGATGSGKSTLVDIIMALLGPTKGTLQIDGKRIGEDNQCGWQAHFSHVPQTIFLADSTLEENIAFGVPKSKINIERVKLAAQQAQIADIIETWPQGYQTKVGERGVRLSGGQRQRIGIARALYKEADVIIFDEATSALDNKTEQAVMEEIQRLSPNLTIIMVAHRLTTLKNCTQVVELIEGEITRIGDYEEIIGGADGFSIEN